MKGFLKFVTIVGVCLFGIFQCFTSDHWQKVERDRYNEREERRKPKVFSQSDDGCTIYVFNNGSRDVLFSRCPGSQTSTENSHTVLQGKTTRTEVEEITNGE